MPIPLRGSAAVTTPQGMILVGGVKQKETRGPNYTNEFFKLQAKYNGTMEWETLPLKLKKGRAYHVAFLIPDNLSHCSNPYILESDDHNASKNGTSKIIEMTDNYLFILLAVFLTVGSIITITILLLLLCFKSGELHTVIDNEMVPLQNVSYEENKNYDCVSISFETSKISNSQLCIKKEIGK